MPIGLRAARRARRAAYLAAASLGLGALFLLLPASSLAQAKAPPQLDELLKKVLARAKWSEEHHLDGKYTYAQRAALDELDSRENVKRHEERLNQVVPIDGEPYARLVQKDGKPLGERDARLEKEREQRFRQRVAERRRKRQQGETDDSDIQLNEELISKYKFELTGEEPVNGRLAYVLRFEPRSSDLPIKKKLDRLLNKLAGQVWIDEQDYEITRADAHLAEVVSAWGGMLASVRKFQMRVEQAKVDETVWLPSTIDAYIDGRILIKSLHVKLHEQNSDFRRVASESAQQGSDEP